MYITVKSLLVLTILFAQIPVTPMLFTLFWVHNLISMVYNIYISPDNLGFSSRYFHSSTGRILAELPSIYVTLSGCRPRLLLFAHCIRSLNRHDLFVPRARTAMAKMQAFAFIGPALWNQLPPLTRSCLLTGGPSASFRCLKTSFFSLGLSHWERL